MDAATMTDHPRLTALRSNLLDLSRRNPLLNARRTFETVGARAAEILNTLLTDEDSTVPITAIPGQGISFDSKPWALDALFADLDLAVRRYQQERGADILALTWGELGWTDAEDGPVSPAPLVILPVRLQRTLTGTRWEVAALAPTATGNRALAERLKSLGIVAPAMGPLDDIAACQRHLGEWTRIAEARGWTLQRDRMTLGCFAFDRLALWEDLDPQRLNPVPPAQHPMVQRLLGIAEGTASDHRSEEPSWTPREAGVAMEVLDNDGSQAEALARVAAGQHLVIQGPPGTGKSQTIVNLISDAVWRGKTVLMLAEKQAALEVVARRLAECGLAGMMWDLGDPDGGRKRQTFEAVTSTWSDLPAQVPEVKDPRQALATATAYLEGYRAALQHRVSATGMTVAEAIGAQPWREPVPEAVLAVVEGLTPETFEAFSTAWLEWEHLVTSLDFPGPPPTDLGATNWDRALVLAALSRCSQRLETLTETLTDLSQDTALPAPTTLAGVQGLGILLDLMPDLGVLEHAPALDPAEEERRFRELAEAMDRVSAQRAPVVRLGVPVTADILHWEHSLTRWPVFVRVMAPSYRQARHNLRLLDPSLTSHAACMEAIHRLRAIDHQVGLLQPLEPARLLGAAWRGVATDPAVIRKQASVRAAWHRLLTTFPEATQWRQALITTNPQRMHAWRGRLMTNRLQEAWEDCGKQTWTPSTWESSLRLEELRQRMESWRTYDRHPQLPAWLAWNRLAGAVRSLVPLDPDLVPSATLTHGAFLRAWQLKTLRQASQEVPFLATWERWTHERHRQRFQEADAALFAWNQHRLREHHRQQLPSATGDLHRQLRRRSRMRPLRQLLTDHADEVPALQRVKPVFLMSPKSVATHLPPGAITFDLLIVDEASQVVVEDAFGAILRCRQVVVVGDDQQLPPTTFFRTQGMEDDLGDDAMPTTSLLDACVTAGLPQVTLRWHYRSRHHQLISVSNRLFYGGKLLTFPNAQRSVPGEGLHLIPVPDGIYQRGTGSVNPGEARAVAKAVAQHVRTCPEHSLGIVAFSEAQRKAIEQAITTLGEEDPDFRRALDSRSQVREPWFVKNLENVQGEERDAMFISIGYGRDSEGVVSMNFGPLSQAGGERRLNVLISRARRSCQVFTNLRPEDLDRSSQAGVTALRTFLAYAANGQFAAVPPQTREGRLQGDLIAEDLATALSGAGLTVHRRVGESSGAVDLAVVDPRDPTRYCFGILLDGSDYLGNPRTRDRERLRDKVLHGLGWEVYRVWRWNWELVRDGVVMDIVKRV